MVKLKQKYLKKIMLCYVLIIRAWCDTFFWYKICELVNGY